MNNLELGMATVLVGIGLSIVFTGVSALFLVWWFKGGQETIYLISPKRRVRLGLLKTYLIDFAEMKVPIHTIFNKLTEKGWQPFEIKLAIKQVRRDLKHGSKKDSNHDSGRPGKFETGLNEGHEERATGSNTNAKKRRWWSSKKRSKDTTNTSTST